MWKWVFTQLFCSCVLSTPPPHPSLPPPLSFFSFFQLFCLTPPGKGKSSKAPSALLFCCQRPFAALNCSNVLAQTFYTKSLKKKKAKKSSEVVCNLSMLFFIFSSKYLFSSLLYYTLEIFSIEIYFL